MSHHLAPGRDIPDLDGVVFPPADDARPVRRERECDHHVSVRRQRAHLEREEFFIDNLLVRIHLFI